MSNQFTPGAATQIAHQCTVVTAGNHPLSPSDTLKDYGVSGSPQVSLITTRIRTDGKIGLPSFGRTIHPNALKDVDTGWTIMNLSDVIFEQSFDIGLGNMAFDMPDSAPHSDSAPERPRPGALAGFTREHPTQAVMMSAAVGMMFGFVLGRILR